VGLPLQRLRAAAGGAGWTILRGRGVQRGFESRGGKLSKEIKGQPGQFRGVIWRPAHTAAMAGYVHSMGPNVPCWRPSTSLLAPASGGGGNRCAGNAPRFAPGMESSVAPHPVRYMFESTQSSHSPRETDRLRPSSREGIKMAMEISHFGRRSFLGLTRQGIPPPSRARPCWGGFPPWRPAHHVVSLPSGGPAGDGHSGGGGNGRDDCQCPRTGADLRRPGCPVRCWKGLNAGERQCGSGSATTA